MPYTRKNIALHESVIWKVILFATDKSEET